MVQARNKRRDKDVTKILVSGFDVELVDETKMNELIVNFPGPKDSPYENVSKPTFPPSKYPTPIFFFVSYLIYLLLNSKGVWRIRVQLPDAYPMKSPSIGFINKIFHPNIDEA